MSNGVEAYQSDGVVVLGSKGSVVRGNTLSGNNWNGLALLDSPGSRVTDNELSGNGNNGSEVNGGSDDTWIVGQHRRRQHELRHRRRLREGAAA